MIWVRRLSESVAARSDSHDRRAWISEQNGTAQGVYLCRTTVSSELLTLSPFL